MDFDEVIKKRKSVRSFANKKASWKDVLEAIDATIQGPFAGNYNHLKFLIIENKAKIREIASLCDQLWINQVGILVLVCSDDAHLEDIYDNRGRIYSRQAAGAAIQTLLLKLTDLGLASCWLGSYSDSEIRKELEIPTHVQIEAILPIGYENRIEKKKIKKDLENVLFWEEWSKRRRPTKFEEEKEDYGPLRNKKKQNK